jgi:hypothetical protein
MLFNLTNLTDVEEVDGIFYGSAYGNNAETSFDFELTAGEFVAYQSWQATGILPQAYQDTTFEGF